MAWPWPGIIVFRHIAQVFLEDLEEFLDKRRPEEEGVGVKGEGRESTGERAEERESATSERRRRPLLLAGAEEEEESSSRVRGT